MYSFCYLCVAVLSEMTTQQRACSSAYMNPEKPSASTEKDQTPAKGPRRCNWLTAWDILAGRSRVQTGYVLYNGEKGIVVSVGPCLALTRVHGRKETKSSLDGWKQLAFRGVFVS